MAGARCHVVVFKTKVLHFKIEKTPMKDTDEKRNSMECSVSFFGQTKAFRYEVVFRGIEPRFYTADRSAWFVFNQPRQRGF